MAGTITLTLTQRPDAAGGRLYWYRAGTVSTPQNAFYDSALTLPLANPYTLDEDGNIPFFYLDDGVIKIVLIDEHGNTLLSADNIPVIGSSSGGGGGGTVDPTTVIQTGQVVLWYGTGSRTGFVRMNGRTIGSATSGATERANADTQAAFLFLYGEDANLSVSGGRGVSAAADWAANKTIALPDGRGRVIAGLDDMGATAAGRLTSTYFGTSAIVLGAASSDEEKALVTANLPAYTPSGTITEGPITGTVVAIPAGGFGGGGGSGAFGSVTAIPISASQTGSTFAGTAQGGTSTPLSIVQPTLLMTLYMKL
eukprot:GHVR01182933.1.p1 GENE.GHVR01182933.1~~GHVR01182933.1.p1  ORF type:complete len:311 (-),score=37.91 GHVR01182933.1:542-1474(-)